MGERQSADDLDRFLDAYTEAWNAGDLDGIVGAYATPCFVVKDGRVLRHQDRAAKRRYFGDLLAAEDGRWRILGDVVHR